MPFPTSSKMMNTRSSNKILVKAAIVLFFFWIIALILLTRPLSNATPSDSNSDMLQRLSQAMSELKTLKEKNEELQWILNSIQSGNVKDDIKQKLRLSLQDSISPSSKAVEPSKEYEVKRRSVFRGVQEMWYFVRAELKKLQSYNHAEDTSQIKKAISDILATGAEHEM